MSAKRSQKIPPPQRAEGIVFHVALHDDRWAETIGVAFEHRGRIWAVHRSTLSEPTMPALFSVSDVETGRSVGQIMEGSVEAARAVAIEKIDRATPEQWASVFPAPQPKKSRARAAA
ncbi:hypothetical protein KDX04_27195 [Burkholderia cenocepacia]|uniref:hypothetical protein n=1 Tax=Burkholderia cenocepacia TaxID=95486 RepID=UPI001B9B6418|nr:hypothetical protein [Burkholderia cenocepacia]MBR7989521.1 hypothetical protein [Burkholderia cenocepacia]